MINLVGAYIVSILLLALASRRHAIAPTLTKVENVGPYSWLAFVALLGWMGWQQATLDPLIPHTLHLIDIPYYLLFGTTLWIHEAGHIYFLIFGRFMQVAGGTLNQLIFPGAFCYLNYRLGLGKTTLVGIFWIGFSAVDISRYVSDARTRALPLLGTDQDGHDWHYLLSVTNLLSWDHTFGRCFYCFGVALMIGALGGIAVRAIRQPTS